MCVSVSVAPIEYHPSGKAKTQKVPCAICHVHLEQIPRHLEQKHADEVQVAEILALSDKTMRDRGIDKLRNTGIFQHNVEILRAAQGLLIVARRSSKAIHVIEDYVPCPFCMAFLVRFDMWRHCSECPHKPEKIADRSFISSGQLLLDGALSDDGRVVDPQLKLNVLSKMRCDKTTAVVKSDDLILRYGTVQLRKKGSKAVHEISQRMRHLGRLRIRMETVSGKPMPLIDSIRAKKFDIVIEAIWLEAGKFTGTDERERFQNPCYATKVGHCLHKCAQVKRGMAIRCEDSVQLKEAEDFIKLYADEYTDLVSSIASTTLSTRKNHLLEFPDEEDFTKLKNYQIRRQLELEQTLSGDSAVNAFVWRELAEVTLSRVIVFNGRRGNEAALLSMEAYEKRGNGHVQQMVREAMDHVETVLMERLANSIICRRVTFKFLNNACQFHL